jgi:hypothetical protein
VRFAAVIGSAVSSMSTAELHERISAPHALVTCRFVGLAGLEPAASSLSEIDGWALCYPAFPQVALIHEWHRDGVNHAHRRHVGRH